MKIRNSILLATALLLFFAVNISFADKGTGYSLLWKLEGKNIETSYIFGTIHILPQSKYGLEDRQLEKIESVDMLITEMDLSQKDLQERINKSIEVNSETNLKDELEPSHYSRLKDLFEKQLGEDLSKYNSTKPFFIYSMLAPSLLSQEKMLNYEMEFTRIAIEQNKAIIGLETPEIQLNAINKISYEVQIEGLLQLIDNPNKITEDYSNLLETYMEGNINKLYEQSVETFKSKDLSRVLLDERNQNWSKIIPELISSRSAFIAVGAAHLGGEMGLINLLQSAGYRLTPIK